MKKEYRYPMPDFRQYRLDEYDLANNPETRVPIVICVDRSFSMRQEQRLERVVEGVRVFCREMARDPIAKEVAELCLISYGGSAARVETDFYSVDRLTIPDLTADGQTPLADAVHLAVEVLEARKKRYQDNGVSYYRPWIIFLGDGDDSNHSKEMSQAAALLKQESDEKHLSVLCITVGDEKKMEYASLMALAPDGRVQYLRDMKFGEFFAWLSKSVQKLSQSLSGEEIQYPATTTWGQLLERK